MKYFTWDAGKNEILKRERNISFEEVIFHIEKGELLDIIEHPNKKKYANQQIIIVAMNNYAYLIPFIETGHEVILKTIIPSRKATKTYLGGKTNA